MLPDRVSKPEPLTYESGALPIVLRGRALCLIKSAKDRRTTPGVCGHGSVPLSHLGELGYGNWNLPLTTRYEKAITIDKPSTDESPLPHVKNIYIYINIYKQEMLQYVTNAPEGPL